jgi:hypothetical protein
MQEAAIYYMRQVERQPQRLLDIEFEDDSIDLLHASRLRLPFGDDIPQSRREYSISLSIHVKGCIGETL